MSNAAKKKGLSIEEKIVRIEQWFVEHPSPYTLKELLSLIPKSTGVIPQSIEECLEVLVSEDRVRQKKIGINVLFWRFPKTAAQQLAATFKGRNGGTAEAAKYLSMTTSELKAELTSVTREETEAKRQVAEMRTAMGDKDAICRDAERVGALQNEERQLRTQLERLAAFDPETVEKLTSATRIAWDAANRWTDNIYLLEQNIAQRTGMNPRELRSQLQLPPEIDYIEPDDRPMEGTVQLVTAAALETSTPPAAELQEENSKEKGTPKEEHEGRKALPTTRVGRKREHKEDKESADDVKEIGAADNTMGNANRRRKQRKEV